MQSGRGRSFIDMVDNGRPGIKWDAQRRIKEHLLDEDSDCEEIKQVSQTRHDHDDIYLPPKDSRDLDGKKSPTRQRSSIPTEAFDKLK